MAGAWLLPFLEDAFQIGRKAITNPGSVKNFFKPSHLGAAGVFGGALRKSPKNWAMNTLRGIKDYSYGGVWPFMAMGAAYYASKAGQGQMLPTFGGIMSSSIPSAVGAAIGGGPGALAAGILFGESTSHWVRSKATMIQQRPRRQMQFEMGNPDFRDTQAAYTMRQTAVAEMSGSLMNARQVLGREALLFHS